MHILLTEVNNVFVANADTRPAVSDAITAMQRLAELFQRRRAQLARRVGLTEQQWRVLEEIATEHFMPSMFARDNESSAAAVSKTIRQLLDKSLVAVSISEADGRQRDYVLTPQGKRLMSELRKLRRRAIDAIWADLPDRQLNNFCATASQLTRRIEAYASEESEE